MAGGGQGHALQHRGDAAEAALTCATQRAAALAQVIAEAAPPPLPVAEVQATIAAWAELPPSDPQRAALLATAEGWVTRLAAVLEHDADYQALVGQYRQAGGTARTVRVSAEAGGLGCHITISVPLDGPAPAVGAAG